MAEGHHLIQGYRVRRLRLIFPETVPPDIPLTDVIRSQAQGREMILTVANWNAQKQAMIQALGPVAYITYRLTRPDLSLVTCANCGRLRRVDQEQCHLCNAAWDVPELTVSAWRVT